MSDEVDEIFKNFDIEKGLYKPGNLEFKLREIKVGEFEHIEDLQAKLKDKMEDKTATRTEILDCGREYNTYFLKTVIGADYHKLKDELTIKQFKDMMGELSSFLINFGGIEELQDYTISLKEKLKQSRKNKQGSS